MSDLDTGIKRFFNVRCPYRISGQNNRNGGCRLFSAAPDAAFERIESKELLGL